MFCSLCSDIPQPGSFGYESFRRLPKLPKRGINQSISQRGSNANTV